MSDGEPSGITQQQKASKTEIEAAELRRRRAAVMVASHNEESIMKAVRRMGELRLLSRDGIFFAQLQGMCDHVSFALGQVLICSLFLLIVWRLCVCEQVAA
jgi:hypothetical protein